MVTSHLGARPRANSPEDTLAPVAARLGELLGRRCALLANWVDGVDGRRRAKSCCSRTAASTRARRRTTRNSRRRWPSSATSTSMTPSAPPTAPRPPRTASPSSRRWPAPACCWRPRSTPWARRCGSPKRPLVAIVAGSKVSTKLTILKTLAGKVDQLIVGGGIANTFLLAAGKQIGKSLAEPDLVTRPQACMQMHGRAGRKCRCRATSWWPRSSRPTRRPPSPRRRRARRRPDPRHRPADRAGTGAVINASRHDRLERAGRRLRVRAVCQRHQDRAGHRRSHRRPSRSPAAATRWRPSPSTTSPSRSATSRPAAALSSNSSKARRCRPSTC